MVPVEIVEVEHRASVQVIEELRLVMASEVSAVPVVDHADRTRPENPDTDEGEHRPTHLAAW